MKIKKIIFSPYNQYVLAVAVQTILIIILFSIQDTIGYETVSLILLFSILLMPLMNFNRGPIILASVIAALGWNYYFIPPHFTFQIAKPEDFMMNVMFFIVALVTGMLTSKLKSQELGIIERESKTKALYNLLKQLADAKNLNEVTQVAVRNIREVFGYQSILIFAGADGKLSTEPNPESSFPIEKINWIVAEWCFNNREKAGRNTKNLVYVDELYIPLIGTRQTLGCIGIQLPDGYKLSKKETEFLDTFISQIVTAAEREILNERAVKNFIAEQSEKLYKTLFNSISHELRTPITTIMSAASTMQDDNLASQRDVRDSLSSEINTASERLNRLVENLLDMTRLESGNIKIKPDWNDINDLINSTLKRLSYETYSRQIKTNVKLENPILCFDFGLIEQAFINIIHNCIIYTPENTVIKIDVTEDETNCIIQITDNGPGFPKDSVTHLFEKFYRGKGIKTGGTGLGLSIAKGFIDAHGGTITAANREPHGASFTITLPKQKVYGTPSENTHH